MEPVLDDEAERALGCVEKIAPRYGREALIQVWKHSNLEELTSFGLTRTRLLAQASRSDRQKP